MYDVRIKSHVIKVFLYVNFLANNLIFDFRIFFLILKPIDRLIYKHCGNYYNLDKGGREGCYVIFVVFKMPQLMLISKGVKVSEIITFKLIK